MIKTFQLALRSRNSKADDDTPDNPGNDTQITPVRKRPSATALTPAAPKKAKISKKPAAACGGSPRTKNASGGLPHGWKLEERVRKTGASAGAKGKYFIAPDGHICRSMVEVNAYAKKQ